MSASAFKKILMMGSICITTLGLSACSQTKEMLGLERSAPDEFAVYSRAPLSLPPDYALKPPRPGAERPQGEDETLKARRALTGRNALAKADPLAEYQAMSPGLKNILEKSGALSADPNIRQTVDRETSAFITENQSFVDDLLFWKDRKSLSNVVDPAKEAQRIREAQALGQPVDGGEAITINRSEKRLLDNVFDF